MHNSQRVLFDQASEEDCAFVIRRRLSLEIRQVITQPASSMAARTGAWFSEDPRYTFFIEQTVLYYPVTVNSSTFLPESMKELAE